MGSIMNGITLHGGTRVYGGTFLVFSDYMRAAGAAGRADAAADHLRVDARLDRPGRGRADPPADRAPGRAARDPGPGRGAPRRRQRDGWCWRAVLEHTDRPIALALSTAEPAGARPRQESCRARAGHRGGYVLAGGSRRDHHRAPAPRCRSRCRPASSWRPTGTGPGSCRCPAWSGSPPSPTPTGSEVLPPAIKARVSVEAGVPQGWREFVGDAARSSASNTSAPGRWQNCSKQFGFTTDRVVAAAARDSLARVTD